MVMVMMMMMTMTCVVGVSLPPAGGGPVSQTDGRESGRRAAG